MDIASIRAVLEDDRTWRQDEIRFLRNQLANLSNAEDKKRYRRSIIPMLYAHYEGFCKVALQEYVNAINATKIPCRDATAAVVAASWELIFRRLANPSEKCDVFRRELPDDSQLHRFARRRHFVEQLGEFCGREAHVPEETVDMESNLTPAVLRKNLFKLGIAVDVVESFAGDINELLNRRHGISHGQDREGLDETAYGRSERAAFSAMESVMSLVMDAIEKRMYRREALVTRTT